jgi:hypothetical protein
MNPPKYSRILTSSDPLSSYSTAINERASNAITSTSDLKIRSIGEHTKYWNPGKNLKILVYRYNDHSFEAVKSGANKWQPYVNLNFEFIEIDEDDIYNSEEFLGDIRVDFSTLYNDGGGSKLGTDSITGSPHAPSMQLGTNFSSDYFQFTVIHEFGHALGLSHEHQHPDAGIPWDREMAYTHFAATAGFSRAVVDANVFPLQRVPSRTYRPYDRHSVMHYPVLNELTVGDWHQPQNLHISEGDIATMRMIYP